MESNPFVTVNILSYNRKVELKNTLQKVFEQDYKNIEVIVVDNASNDGSDEMVSNDFPNVILIKMQKNIGIAGWNEGFKIARGEYVLVLDDDSYPDSNSIRISVERMQCEKKLGIIAFEIFNKRIQDSETKNFLKTPYLFVGCGAFIKREVIEKIGGFNIDYFIYLHELDYSALCYDSGFSIEYLPNVYVFHNQNMNSRGGLTEDPFLSSYRFRHYFISYTIFLVQRFSWYFSMFFLLKWFINRMIVCVFKKYYKAYFLSTYYILKNSLKILRNRKVLTPSVQKFYRFGNETLIDRTYFPEYRKRLPDD